MSPEVKRVVVKAWQGITRDEPQCLLMSMLPDFRLEVKLQRIYNNIRSIMMLNLRLFHLFACKNSQTKSESLDSFQLHCGGTQSQKDEDVPMDLTAHTYMHTYIRVVCVHRHTLV